MAEIKVELIDHMGSDLSVVNAARVSFDKASSLEWYTDANGCQRNRLSDADRKLIAYLAKHNHWSPFAHCYGSFRVQAPIFVARQLQKHTVGLAWNEVSRRYVDSEPTFYTPDRWRKRAENVKQGSSDEEAVPAVIVGIESFHETCAAYYQDLIDSGVCPEQARMVLPQSMMTEWIWSGSLYAFARVCKLRLDPTTQKETQEVARQIASQMASTFPVSWDALLSSSST